MRIKIKIFKKEHEIEYFKTELTQFKLFILHVFKKNMIYDISRNWKN
jgi:hypothetical protein